MIKFSAKKRTVSGEWIPVTTADLAGKTMQQFFDSCHGKEIVAEIEVNNIHCYLCGTPHWIERMQKKGKTASFQQAIIRLQELYPELLAQQIPGVDLVSRIFEGSNLETVEII